MTFYSQSRTELKEEPAPSEQHGFPNLNQVSGFENERNDTENQCQEERQNHVPLISGL